MVMKRQHGFAFIEILVSIVIIGLGLLGVSALQSNALRATHDAYLRSAANEYAVALAERIRTNTGDAIYRYDDDSEQYQLVPMVACYLQAVSATALANQATICNTASVALRNIATSDTTDMTQWLSSLPQATWSLSLLQNGAVANNLADTACNFSMATGSTASQPCSLRVNVGWSQSNSASGAISYSFR